MGGGAGIIALGSTNKGNVIPGVAIATALMPPFVYGGLRLGHLADELFLRGYISVYNQLDIHSLLRLS